MGEIAETPRRLDPKFEFQLKTMRHELEAVKIEPKTPKQQRTEEWTEAMKD